ncbi:MAG: hypothetical protein WC875_05210 [Candidatus Absconditabacterales bacterium]|jgi:hypothetical protein
MEKKSIGVFDAKQLLLLEGRNEILEFSTQHEFFVLRLTKELKDHPVVKEMQMKAAGYHFTHLAFVVNGKGTERFKDIFHRSSSYIDDRMFSHKNLKKLFEHKETLDMFELIKANLGEIQVRGVKHLRVRAKHGIV